MEYLGKTIKLNIEGKSHSKRIVLSLDGIKAGEEISLDRISSMLLRRSAVGKDYATKRKEEDKLIITSGIEAGKATGDPIIGYFENKDTRSKDYSQFKITPRPSHIDYVAMNKFGDDFDLSGSSNFSGRLSVALVAIGSIAKQILESKSIYIGSHFLSLYDLSDDSFDLTKISKDQLQRLDVDLPFINEENTVRLLKMIEDFKLEEDSFGGVIQLAIIGETKFIGDAYFERLQAQISRLVMSIPGTKGVEFGNGFIASTIKGSQNNDSWILEEGKVLTKTNNSGGINGGIANGMPIIFNVSIKPTSSISKEQSTLNIQTNEQESLSIQGRHDPAFILRVPPVVESMVAIALLDLIYEQERKSLREKIDIIDDKLMDLYIRRMKITDNVGEMKLENGQEINDPIREQAIISRLTTKHPDYSNEIKDIYKSIFEFSKKRQDNIIKKSQTQYGLLGRKLGYSYSKEIHERFADYNYELIELRPEEVETFLQRPGLKGLNVTIPYKKEVIPYLDELTREAKQLGVVNTIKFEDGKKIGLNTDFYGFKKLLINKKIYVKNKKAIVLGTGATSKTIEAVLYNMGAKEVVFVSRSGQLNYENIYDLEGYQVLINATPVGMYPNTEQVLVELDRMKDIEYVVDVVYNPMYSRLVFEAKKRGLVAAGGLEMLIFQAKKSVEIFLDKKINETESLAIRDDIVMSKCNIVLVGMPGSGKTTIGRHLSKRLNKKHVDLDEEFFNLHGVRPSAVLEEFGEKRFRQMESEVVELFGKMNNLVISTGGGVVTIPSNYYHLKQNSLIILIDRDVKKLSTRNRPLSQGGIKNLYNMKRNRDENYKLFSDVKVINNGYFRFAVEEIMEIIKEKVRDL